MFARVLAAAIGVMQKLARHACLKDKDGEPSLKYEDGTAFKPASTEHYTFNSALQLRNSSEPHEEGGE